MIATPAARWPPPFSRASGVPTRQYLLPPRARAHVDSPGIVWSKHSVFPCD